MKNLSFAFVASLVLTLGSNTVRSATIVWTNVVSGNWNAATNWNPNQVPLAADNAVITNNGTYTVTLDASASVASLTLGGASGTQSFALNANTLTLNGASTVGAHGSFNLTGGTLNGTGSFTVNGPFAWSGGIMANTGGLTLNGTSTLNGPGFATMQLAGLLVNGGALTWGGSGANLYFSGGTLTNLAAGTITVTADVSTANGGGVNLFANVGLLRKTGGTGTTAMVHGPFVNSGDVQVQSGTFEVAGGGSASGTFEVSANAFLQFGGSSTYTLNVASGVTGAGGANFSGGVINAGGTYNLTGTNIFSGATANFSGSYSITNQAVTISAGAVNFNAGGIVKLTGLTLSGGSLGGTLPVPVNGPFAWSGGIMANTGGLTLNGTSTLNGPGFATMQLAGLLVNGGALTWGGSGANLYFSGGTLTNLAAGTITVTADVSTANGGGVNLFANVGLLRKTGGTGTTAMVHGPFVNSGDVQVQSGTFEVAGGGSASGTFEVSANAFLQFGGSSTYTLNVASGVTGAGGANFSGGVINAGGTYNLTGTNIFSGATANFSGSYSITNQAVTISAGAVNFNAGGIVKLTGLTLSGGSLGGTLPVPVNGPFAWSGGIMANTGGLTLNGTSTLNGPGFATMQLAGLLVNGGALTWGGSGANLYFSGGTLTNLAAGTITVTADVSTANGGGVNLFANVGLLRKTGGTGTTAMVHGPFVNSGDVQVQSGTFEVAGGGSASGTFEVSANAFLQFGGSSTYTLNVASGVTGAGGANFSGGVINAGGTYNLTGTNIFSGATANFSGSYSITNQAVTISAGAVNFNAGGIVKLTGLTLSGGSLGGTLPVPVNGPFAWSGGIMANTGGLTLNGTSTLNGPGFATMQLAGLLVNGGALTWGGSGANLYFSGGTLTNLAAGTITVTADVSTANGGGVNLFANVGLLRKTGGTGTTAMVHGPFVNSGDVQVQSGTFEVAGGGSASGTFEVSANAFLQFGGSSTYTLNVASGVTGAGGANFSGGVINAGGTYNLTGTNIFSGATANFSGSYSITNQAVTISAGAVNFNAGGIVKLTGLTLSGGSLGGTLPVPVNGPFAWSGGIMANTGGLTLNGTSTLNGPGFATMQLAGLLVNGGALTWGGSGANLYFSGGTLTNLAAGTITVTADVSTANGGGVNLFANVGLLRKTGGTGTTAMAGGIAFVNTGTLDTQNGNLALQGAYTLANGTKMGFGLGGSTGNGSITLSGTASFSGSLSVNLNNFFWPAVGSSFNLLNYTSESGLLFTNTTLPTGNFTWQTNYNPATFALSAIARTGTNLVSTNLFLSKLNGTNLILQWPGDHTGWRIQVQTNPVTAGLGTNWSDLAGASLTNQIVMPASKTNGPVFFRMIYP